MAGVETQPVVDETPPPQLPTPIVNTMQMVPIRQIKPYQRNPRKNDETVDKLVELIPRVGFNVPLVLDRNNVIVKGHSRWRAAIRLRMDQLPCVYSDADEETIRLDRLADNRVQEFSSWDDELLQAELGALNLSFDFDLASLNFSIGAPAVEDPPLPNGGDELTQDGPFITEEDVNATVPLKDTEYLEVVCNHCGNKLYVKRTKVWRE